MNAWKSPDFTRSKRKLKRHKTVLPVTTVLLATTNSVWAEDTSQRRQQSGKTLIRRKFKMRIER